MEIDRKRLAAIVFSNRERLAALNAIVHPVIFKGIADGLDRLRHGDGIVVPHEATGGRISFVEMTMSPRHLIRGHVHERTDVWIYVLHGEVGVRVGDDEAIGTPGDYLLKPRGVPHAMWNPGDEPNRLIEILTPGDGDLFFRDAASWEYLRDDIVPRIVERKKNGHVRVWSAGCASGEEAYTIAILLAEAMGPDAFRDRAKIYATDADEEALAQARQAAYGDKDLEPIPTALRDRYFETSNGRFVFRGDLRRSVIFGRHDLVQDAPISRLDLLICRNTVMYLNAETQSRILTRFHFALDDGGFLFLGRAEMLLSHGNLFTPLNLRARVFSKVHRVGLRDRLLVMAPAGGDNPGNPTGGRQERLRETLFETAPVAQAVVDAAGILTQANARIRSMFGITPKDLGRPLQDLELSYRPAELRSLIDQATNERRSVALSAIERRLPDGELQYLDLDVAPLFENGGGVMGVSITFTDVTSARHMQEELRRSNEELETAYEELQSSNEELETTNEELQSSNEELETTNEELQSSNEELETMNEELQSSNEELQTVNDELRQRTNEVNHLNTSLQAVLAALPSGLVVLDRDFNVLLWNQRAEDMWGVRADEVRGHSIFTLDIGLPLDRLQAPLRALLAGETAAGPQVMPATNRRGRAIQCEVRCARIVSPHTQDVRFAVIMDEVTERPPG